MKRTLIQVAVLLMSGVIAFAQNVPVIVVHGGAGAGISKGNFTDAEEKAHLQTLEKALKIGYEILESGGTCLDAVEKTIMFLEDSPLFNAGVGSVLNSEGKPELDASIMEGKTLKAGAVAGVTTIKNPIQAARCVMEQSPHVMMIGKGAEVFAKSKGLTMVKPEYFITEKAKQSWKAAQQQQNKKSSIEPPSKFGTVGCVALDKYGNLAAGTSTGGMMNKKYGRVGDSPIIGAGTYADNNTCAVSATGHGEYFIRSAAAFRVSALMQMKGLSVSEATQQTMDFIGQIGGTGGLIALDKKGNIYITFNTDGMFRGYIDANKKMEVQMYK
ncbi:MAG: isoaspartyl peptidase/L-asparaginase [Bacteroidia bacterium]|nr:isoaspartyl peptidase/L-asparaginase [Bacteroidia bacterium]MDW8302354.1 isoaspartyl peptidase/L-asparaginase [Bacteroidia bacterium]